MLVGDGVASDRLSARWFAPALSALAALGVLVRVVYAVTWEHDTPLIGDPKFFQQTAASLAHGNGYAVSFLGMGRPVATAGHPPLFPVVLTLLDVARIESADAHRVALAFVSVATVVLMGILGRRLMSPGTGLVAATFAALSPLWIQWGGRLLSECVYLVVIPLLLLVALVCVDRPGWRMFAVVGVVIGIATLTRSEAIAFVVVLGIPLVLMGTSDWKRRATYGLALVAGVVLIVTPWLVRNEIQLKGFVLSSDSGTTWVGAYTPTTFSPANPLYGSFDNAAQFADAAVLYKYGKPPDHAKAWTELTLNNALGNLGMTFARGHLSDLPGVVLAREGRLWGVYSPGTQLQNDGGDGGQVKGFYIAGYILEWVTIPLALAGAIVLGRRSRRRLVVVLTPIVTAALNAGLFFGSTRLRVVAEPSLFLLSSIAIVSAVRWIRTSTTAVGATASAPVPTTRAS